MKSTENNKNYWRKKPSPSRREVAPIPYEKRSVSWEKSGETSLVGLFRKEEDEDYISATKNPRGFFNLASFMLILLISISVFIVFISTTGKSVSVMASFASAFSMESSEVSDQKNPDKENPPIPGPPLNPFIEGKTFTVDISVLGGDSEQGSVSPVPYFSLSGINPGAFFSWTATSDSLFSISGSGIVVTENQKFPMPDFSASSVIDVIVEVSDPETGDFVSVSSSWNGAKDLPK